MLVTRGLRPSQDKVLQFLRDYKADEENDGNSPTYQQIAEALEISQGTAYTLVLRMVKRGVVKVNRRGKITLGGKYIPPSGR
jgi:Mn-dependent DtxR family transcriptional regulator